MMAQNLKKGSIRRNKIHPLKFMMFVSIASLFMLFVAFTSFYLVRKSSGNWHEFELPSQFFISAGVMLLSSLTIHFSRVFFEKENKMMYKLLLFTTLILGFVFVYLQYSGWKAMEADAIYLTGNASGATIYVISALHVAHVLGGVVGLILANLHANILPFEVTDFRKLRLELTSIYWHFVDILWIFLLLIFVTQ